MSMRRAYHYRLYPNTTQARKLEWTLDRCRELYNACVQERRDAYRMCGMRVGRYDQDRQLPAVKEVRPEYAIINSQLLQNVVRRVDLAFQAFFRRVKAGETPGYPRFKGTYRYTSFTLAQTGWKRPLRAGGRLYLATIGHITMKWSRPIEGASKTVTIKRDGNQWYATFSCVLDAEPPTAPDRPPVGVDVGLEYFATLSSGAHIDNPCHYRRAQERIVVCAQRVHTKKKRSRSCLGKNRMKAALTLRKAHRKVANQRRDHHHKAALDLVRAYGAIAVEKLNAANMTRRPTPVKGEDGSYAPNGASAKSGLNKSINDAGWAQFLTILHHKAEEAGVVVIAVNPAGTSQACSGCGMKVPKALSERWHTCPHCGLSMQRDHNAARNILHRAGLVPSAA